MSNYIETRKIDLTVLGQRQVEYVIEGQAGYCYAEACTRAAYKRAATMEREINPLSVAMRTRSRKLEDVSNALANINGFLAQYASTKLDDNGQKSSPLLASVYATLTKYGLNVNGYVKAEGTCSKPDAIKLQTDVQLALDKENNSLQQDSNTLQSLLSKRDQAFTSVGKIQQKLKKSSNKTIENIGA